MSQKDVIKWTSFIRLASFKPIFSPLTYSPVKTPLWRICAQEKWSEWVWERCTLSLKSAYRTYNVLCISDVLKCIFPILLIIFQWGKTLNIFLFPFALRLFFLPNGGQFYLFLCKMHLKRKIPQETRLNIDNVFIYNFTFLDIVLEIRQKILSKKIYFAVLN